MPQYYYDNQPSGPGSFFSRIPVVTRNILIINLLMYLATIVNENFMVSNFAMFYPESRFFHFWQPVTYMFMHGSFWHLFFNMFCLLMFGSALERTIGSRKYLVLYFITGLGAVALQCGVQFFQIQAAQNALQAGDPTAQMTYMNLLRTPTVGASGAIYGIQIAYAMLFPNDVWTLVFPPISMKAKWFVLIFVIIELFTGVTGTAAGVAHFAHLGGMLFGFLLIYYWRKTGKLWRQDEWF